MSDQYTSSLVEQLMREAVAGTESCDRYIPHRFIQKMLDYTTHMQPYLTSMKIDYDQRRPLEVEAIFGNPLRIVSATASMPAIATLYHQLKFLDAKNRR